MMFDGEGRESDVSRTVSDVLYPDLVELGGLVDALEHVASDMGVDLEGLNRQVPIRRAVW